MKAPWKFRPVEEGSDWEDNWVSNTMAWTACTLMPSWCNADANENHWTIRLTNYLFASCPCCFLFRGISLGIAIGILVSYVTYILFGLFTS